MNSSTVLKCRVLYCNKPIATIAISCLYAVWGAVIYVFAHGRENPMATTFLLSWVVFGFVVPLLLGGVIGSMLSTFIISSDGITEIQGYFNGLRRKKVHTPWSDFVSWDLSHFYAPATRETVPQIKIYYKNGGHVWVNAKLRRMFRNDMPVKWGAFSSVLIKIMDGAGVPKATPRAELKKRQALALLAAGAAAILIVLILFAAILSIIVGKMPSPALLAAGVFAIAFAAGVGKWLK